MQSADALLLFGDRGEQAKQYIPGKLYEYLYAGPPILAILAPDGEAASVLTNARAGSAFSPEDVDAIVDEIVRLVTNRRKNVLSFVPNRSEIEKYSRQSQTMQLAALMDEVTSREDESSG
jgi:glycosyltransferase involved in cell wall biosynthesis